MYKSLCRMARAVSSGSLAHVLDVNDHKRTMPLRRKMWLEMLGLHPLPSRTPLKVKITGSLRRDGYIVDKLHFQSLSGAYVNGNLYRPENNDRRLPAVLYLCGHSKQGKMAPYYQANPRWFAQHGYVALVLDPVQVGESQGIHHGTFRYARWDWYSRGYTPAGIEVWNAMRALDYLETRPDVDGKSLGVTGLSGGGAMSWFLAAADTRIKCVAPVCQTGSMEQLVVDRSLDRHCDCAVWMNYYRWCTPDIGALIAPRPLLIASGTEDVLWRPYAFQDVFHRIRHQYAALNAGDKVRLVEDLSPHGYTEKLRKAIFGWFNLYLKNDCSAVQEDVSDFVEPERNLQVFKSAPPRNDAMRKIDVVLPLKPAVPTIKNREQWNACQKRALKSLRELTFRHIPDKSRPALVETREDGDSNTFMRYNSYIFHTSDQLDLRVRVRRPPSRRRCDMCVFALAESARTGDPELNSPAIPKEGGTACVEVRNTASTSVGAGLHWTLRRAYPLLGNTLPERQVADLLDGVEIIRQQPFAGPITLYGEGPMAVLAVYAAILRPEIKGLVLANLPESHEDPETPEFLGILRIGDLPLNLALLYPRPVVFVGKIPAAYKWTVNLYRQLGKGNLIRCVKG